MLPVTSYDTLIAAVKAEAEDDGTEFEAFLPISIDAAEETLYKILDLPELEETQTGTVNANDPYLDKPEGYEMGSFFFIRNSTSSKILVKKLKTFILDYWPNPGETNVPKYYGDHTRTQFILAPTPESNYGYELRYSKKPTKLSVTNQTNYYTENCSDILFYATMVQMSLFMKAWTQVPQWEALLSASRDGWNIQASRYRRDDGDVPMANSAGPNSLKQAVQNTQA
jgi:hypothetical protein